MTIFRSIISIILGISLFTLIEFGGTALLSTAKGRVDHSACADISNNMLHSLADLHQTYTAKTSQVPINKTNIVFQAQYSGDAIAYSGGSCSSFYVPTSGNFMLAPNTQIVRATPTP